MGGDLNFRTPPKSQSPHHCKATKNLNKKYFVKALRLSNPLIENLFENYFSFKEGNPNSYSTTKTILCHMNHIDSQKNVNKINKKFNILFILYFCIYFTLNMNLNFIFNQEIKSFNLRSNKKINLNLKI